MPLLSIMVGLFCGLFVWLVLEQVQPRALKNIFADELKTRLEQQARETLIRYNNYVTAHTSTTRLLANHRQLSQYLEPVYWFESDKGAPIVYLNTPPWLPSASLWRTLIQPSHILLIDNQGRTREIYQVGKRNLPPELAGINELFPSENRVQALLTTLGEKPYLLVSETAEDATGTVMGLLMMVAPIDEQFLTSSQQGVALDDVVVGLLDADEQRFLSSSDFKRLPPGMLMEKVEPDYQVTAQSFFEYEGSTINIQFATLVPNTVMEAIRDRVAGLERRQRIITATAFVSIFTLVFYLLSERLNRILRRISLFSRRALGEAQPVMEQGNQLFVLEDWIKQFIRLVRDARDEMRQEHEFEMQESEALKRTIMEAALDSIVTIDETGRIIEFNNTAAQTLGHDRDEVIGEVFAELMLDVENQPMFRNMLNSFLDNPGGQKEEVQHEMWAVTREGSQLPVEISIKPIQLKTRVVFTVYMHDISNRRRAEQVIRSLAKFPSESPSPVLRVNQPGVIIYANAASDPLLEYWGCEQGQTLPLYWKKRISDVFQSRRDWESQLVCGDRIYSLLVTPVVDLGYVNIYGRDITAVRQAEHQAREHQQELVHVCRLSTMGEMATGLAHELNQPLSAIANYANGCVRRLQLSGKGEEDILHALGQINSQADRAGEIIKRLRSLIGKQPPIRSVADINQLVKEVCSFVEFEARKTNVVIEQELSLVPLKVRVDVVQIEQVLLNLVRNALDALLEIQEDDRSLIIRTSSQRDEYILIEVLDSGPGIQDEAMSRLFEPFYTTKESGMGMGLVISQTIIEDHNGKISAERLEEGGTRFSIMIPSEEERDEY